MSPTCVTIATAAAVGDDHCPRGLPEPCACRRGRGRARDAGCSR